MYQNHKKKNKTQFLAFYKLNLWILKEMNKSRVYARTLLLFCYYIIMLIFYVWIGERGNWGELWYKTSYILGKTKIVLKIMMNMQIWRFCVAFKEISFEALI